MKQDCSTQAATILVVDDDESLLNLMRLLLEFEGHTAITASSGVAAERLVRERGAEIDLVIVDLCLPDISGPHLLRHLRAIQPNLKGFLITGYSPKTVQDRRDVGSAYFLHKPFDLTTILNKVQEMLAESGEGCNT